MLFPLVLFPLVRFPEERCRQAGLLMHRSDCSYSINQIISNLPAIQFSNHFIFQGFKAHVDAINIYCIFVDVY